MSNLHARLGGDALEPTAPRTTRRPLSDDDFVTIRCRFAVDELHADNLVSDIVDAAARSEHVVVDLSATARIDSTGLGALVSAARSCRDAGSVLHIVGAHGMVARALHFTGLSQALSTHATVEDACRGQ